MALGGEDGYHPAPHHHSHLNHYHHLLLNTTILILVEHQLEQHGKYKDGKDKDRDSKDKDKDGEDKDKTTIITLNRQVEQRGNLRVEGAQCDGTALVNLQVKPISSVKAIIP